MIKTLKFEDKEIRLSNNISWALIYRDQFGTDIVPTLTPMVAALMDIVAGFVQSVGADKKTIELVDLLAALDGDVLINAVAHLSSLEFVDMINITWAMAKAADSDIPEPRIWVTQFETFPVDEIAPEIVKMTVRGLVSAKNVIRLKGLIDKVKEIKINQPSTQTQSSLQVLSEG